MISLRGPLCAGEAFSLRPRGRGGGNCKPWRDVGPRFVLPLRSTPRPHISPLGWLRQKGWATVFHGICNVLLEGDCRAVTYVAEKVYTEKYGLAESTISNTVA